MKNTTILKKTGGGLIAAFALMSTSAVFAGDTYTEPAPVMPPPAQPSLWNWFIGGSVGYLNDLDNEYWAGHIGAEKICGVASHAIFLEVGWTGDDQTFYYNDLYNTREKIEADMIPITLNYKYERPLFNSQRINWYLGGGLGALYGDIEFTAYDDIHELGSADDDDWVFFGQIFAGITWNLTEQFEIFGGGRWMHFDDLSLAGASIDSNDDWMGELGIRWNF